MPQVVKTQPTGAFAQGRGGIGAVIFDKPQYDLSTIQFKVADDLDNWAKDKAIEAKRNKKAVNALIADLNFDEKGIYDRDAEYFVEGKRKLIDAQAKLASLQPETPEWNKAYYEAKNERDKYQTLARASVNQKEQIKIAVDEFSKSPEKYDADYFQNWLANVRLEGDPLARTKSFEKSPLRPPTLGIEDLTIAKLKAMKDADLLKPQTVKNSFGQTPSGENILIEQTEIMPEGRRYSVASDWVASDSKIKDWALSDYSGMPQVAKDFYDQKAAVLSQKYGKTITPYAARYGDILEKYNVADEKITGMGYSPMQSAMASQWGKGQEEKRIGSGLLELVSGAFQGTPERLSPRKTHFDKNATGVSGFEGYNMGTMRGVDLPNPILEVNRTSDGKVLVMTAQSLKDAQDIVRLKKVEQIKAANGGKELTQDELNEIAAQPIDKKEIQEVRAYKIYDNATQLANDIATGHYGKDGGELIRRGMNAFAEEKGAYTGGASYDVEKITKLTDEQKQKRDAIYGKRREYINIPVSQEPKNLETKYRLGGGQKPAEQKASGAKKEVSVATIRSKVGTKGYEGYTEKELIDYYRSQGYTIK